MAPITIYLADPPLEGGAVSVFRSVHDLDFRPLGPVTPSPADWRDHFIYFLLVDRFDDGNPATPPFDATARKGRDREEGAIFQGGNLKGVIRRLDYIKDLGAGAIWLSPVLKNRQESPGSYHGYGIQDFLAVDPRFGTAEDLRELVRQAHLRGIYVVMDVIINHTGDNWAYKDDPRLFGGPHEFGSWREVDPAVGFQPDDAVWPVELQDPGAYKRRGQITDFDNPDQAVNGDFFTLKELDLNRPEVLDTLIKAHKHWVGFADLDGFRIDTVKHLESSAAAIFCNAIREYAQSIGKHNFFMFGEIVADDTTIQQYIGRNARLPGTEERFPSLDAALDFPLYFMLEEILKGVVNPAGLRDRYERFKTLYADHGAAGNHFVTFVDNHDQMSRPYRRFLHASPFPNQAALAMGYLLTTPGVPCLYYGTEQGFDGGGDNDRFIRECMFGGKWGAFDTTGRHFFDPSHPLYQEIARIAGVRRREPALRYGRLYFREISGNGTDFGHPLSGRCTLAYSRILDSTEIVVALNLEAEPRDDFVTVDLNLTPAGGELANQLHPGRPLRVVRAGSRNAVRIPLQGHEVAILKLQP